VQRHKVKARLDQASVGADYNAEAGFVPRTGYNFLGPYLSYTWVPNKTVVAHGPYFESENYFNTGYEKIDGCV